MSAKPAGIGGLDASGVASDDTRILAIMPTIPVGGMERSNMEIFRLLQSRGVQVSVVTQDGYGNRVQSACAARGLRTIPVSVHCDPRAPRNPIALARYVLDWLSFVRQIGRAYRSVRPDWLYLTNLSFFLYSWPILLIARCKVIFALPIPPDEPRSRMRKWLVRRMWRWVIAPMCTHIVCNSHFTRERLRDTGAKPRSARVIYCPPSIREQTDGPKLPVSENGRLKVTYVGRISPSKGISEIFAAAERMVRERADVEFFFAGDYEWKNPYARALVERARSPALRDRIHFLGELENVPKLLARSDLHVVFSKEEAFGLVVLEAKNEGVPSVVSPGGALPELVNHLEDGFVCSETTSDALREGLEYFLNDAEARKRAGFAAQRSLVKFAHERVADRWSELLELS